MTVRDQQNGRAADNARSAKWGPPCGLPNDFAKKKALCDQSSEQDLV